MNNIVSFAGNTAPAKPSSPILFTAYERPLYFKGKDGVTEYNDTGHKALVRMKDDKPYTLNVVRDTYQMVQNSQLFEVIDQGLFAALGVESSNAEIYDKVSYGGRTCMREYRFPNIRIDSPERDSITFRVIALNGFGTAPIKLITGAIDGFCTNGMIFGEYVKEYARHTSGLKIGKFEHIVRQAVEVFWKERATWTGLRNRKVISDDMVKKFFDERFGERLGAKLFHQYLIEQRSRGGNNLWAVYSAMTQYASHNDGAFTLRDTGNDHTAATMLKREHDVRNAYHHEDFQKLAA